MVDLADLASVKRAAKDLERLDVADTALMQSNQALGLPLPQCSSTFPTNGGSHGARLRFDAGYITGTCSLCAALGEFLQVSLIQLPLLKSTYQTTKTKPRVICVSSNGHNMVPAGDAFIEELTRPSEARTKAGKMCMYYYSKMVCHRRSAADGRNLISLPIGYSANMAITSLQTAYIPVIFGRA